MIRAGIVGVTFLAVVALLVLSDPALDIRAGQRATRDYAARVTFTAQDMEAANYEQESARRKQPNCYRIQQSALQAIRDETAAILRRIRFASNLDQTVAQLAAQRQVNLLEPESFRKELVDLGDGLNALLDAFFARAAKKGILGAKEFKDEAARGRSEIAILRGPEAEPMRVKLTEVLTLGDGGESLETWVARMFPKQSDIFRSNLRAILAHSIARSGPVLKYDADASDRLREAAAAKVAAPIKEVKAGEIILRRGQIARPRHIYELKAERKAYRKQVRGSKAQMQTLAGVAAPLAILFWALGAYVRRFQTELLESKRRLFMLCALCLAVLGAGKVLVCSGLPALWTPIALASIIVSMSHGERFGVLVSFLLAVGLAVMQRGGVTAPIALGLGGTIAALRSVKIDRRVTMIKVGLVTAGVQFAAVWAVELARVGFPGVVTTEWLLSVLAASGWAFLNGVVIGLLTSSMLPVIEFLFGITTDITLLELSDLNQPALQELMLAAPGTYHHSMVVGMLAEDAAKVVNANALLARVGAYYHDIGKMNKPEYFVENAPSGVSQHTDLAPTVSALVITAHTKDGAELADAYSLPPRIKDIILQHHGTTRVEYFYREALKENGEENVEEDAFRYRGPKPQTKEAAIVMLADAVESASRVLSEPNPGRIEGLVEDLIDRRLRDGQFDECDMTFLELKQVRDSLTRGLIGTFHSRIKYPEPEASSAS